MHTSKVHCYNLLYAGTLESHLASFKTTLKLMVNGCREDEYVKV